MLDRVLFMALLIGIPLALGIFIDRFIIGTQSTVETITVVQKQVEIANLSVNVSSTVLRKDVVVPPRSVFVQPFISTKSSIMVIYIKPHTRLSVNVFVAIENNGELALLQPAYSIESSGVLMYRVPIPPGIGAVILLNTGIEKAVIDLEIRIAD